MARYIDADALTERIWREAVDTREKIAKIIANEPAVDVAPVRHGRWEPYVESLRWRCSECGSFIDIDPIDEIIGKSLPNFCPQCGALMDKGDNDGENT